MIDAPPRDLPTDAYTAYSYSYPHKSAYGPLSPPVSLDEVWRREPKDALFLYLHVPFCEMRCGFCNLFAASQPEDDAVEQYLAAIERQGRVVRGCLGAARFARMALGGGTPTMLAAGQLARLFDFFERVFGADPRRAPTSVESSPRTADADRLGVLRERGVARISLGVQSFVSQEARGMGRPQDPRSVYAALERIRELEFPVLCIDLIYGEASQTPASWLYSLDEALRFRPEELFLYPLYVRRQTGLARTGATASTARVDLYRAARERLLERGYRQVSMRCFRTAEADEGEVAYCCQRDGMLGLGCGARSYTSDLHYSSRFAVEQAGVRSIIAEWVGRPDRDYALAHHGLRLNLDERRRRYVVLSLLQSTGLDLRAYEARFDGPILRDLPILADLAEREWIEVSEHGLRLTSAGMERSDAIGPALYSPFARDRLLAFVGS